MGNAETTLKPSIIQEKLHHFKSYLAELRYQRNGLSNVQVIALKARTEDFENLHSKYELIQHELRSENRKLFTSEYFRCLAEAREMIATYEKNNQNNDLHSATTGENKSSSNVDHTPQKLPKFDGSPEKWSSFCDQFEAHMESEQYSNHTDAQKLLLLHLSLEDSVSKIVYEQQSQQPNKTYKAALKALTLSYLEIKRRQVHDNVNLLLTMDEIRHENPEHIERRIANVSDPLSALKKLDQPTEHWDTFIVCIVVSKLDRMTVQHWDAELKSGKFSKLPTWEDLEQFLKNRVAFLKRRQVRCFYCSANGHRIFVCKQFLELSVKERHNEIQKRGLCRLCLCRGHLRTNCSSPKRCRKCNGTHNDLLHNDEACDEKANS